MRKPRFYYNASLNLDKEYVLSKKTSHHLVVVLRLGLAQQCLLFNGDGAEYLAEITSLHKNAVKVLIVDKLMPVTESCLKIHLAQAVSAADRMDYTMQKATELGVTSITPILTENITFKWKQDKSEKKLAHWRNISISASEQSFRTSVPTINQALKFNEFIQQKTQSTKLLLDTSGDVIKTMSDVSLQDNELIILVGPESGFSEGECHMAREHGYENINFGPRILRTETVAPAVLAVAQFLWGDI